METFDMQLRSWLRAVPLARIAAAAALAAALPSLGLAQSAAVPQDTPALRAALQNDLDAYLKDRGVKEHLSALSLSVSLAQGRPAINLTAGTTRYGSGPPVTPTNLYQIGS